MLIIYKINFLKFYGKTNFYDFCVRWPEMPLLIFRKFETIAASYKALANSLGWSYTSAQNAIDSVRVKIGLFRAGPPVVQIRPEMLSPRRGKDLNGQCALASPSEGRLVIFKHPFRRLIIKDTHVACVNCEVVKRKFARGRSKCPLTHSKPFTATMRACV